MGQSRAAPRRIVERDAESVVRRSHAVQKNHPFALALLAGIALLDCGPPRARTVPPAFEPEHGATELAPTPSMPDAARALVSGSGYVDLAVPGHGDAVVSVPAGTSSARPVIIAAHGNFDRPEWQCRAWRYIVGNRAFVLCPRGVARTDTPPGDNARFTYAGDAALAKEIEAGLAALHALFGAHVDSGPVAYAGFSLGAIYGPAYITHGATTAVSLAVMIEGSQEQWSDDRIRAFRARGGRKVLLACGQSPCVTRSRALVARFERAGFDAHVVYGEGAGHAYTGAVAHAIREDLDWLVGDDARFERTWLP